MWFKKKTELEKLIISYGQEQETLLEFARTVGKPRIEECTLEDIKGYYRAIVEPMNSRWRREDAMKSVRKFFRANRGSNILKASAITDNPLNFVGQNVIIEPMKKPEKKKRGRKPDFEMIKKVKFLKDSGGLTMREVAAIVKKDLKNVHEMYHYPKGYSNVMELV